MRRLGAGLPGSRVRLSPMPGYEGENNQARHQLTLRKELLCGPVQAWQTCAAGRKPGGTLQRRFHL
jgi:hypothetical protein